MEVGERIEVRRAGVVLLGEPDLIAAEHRLADDGTEQVSVVRREHQLRAVWILRRIIEHSHDAERKRRVQARLQLIDAQQASTAQRIDDIWCEIEQRHGAGGLQCKGKPCMLAVGTSMTKPHLVRWPKGLLRRARGRGPRPTGRHLWRCHGLHADVNDSGACVSKNTQDGISIVCATPNIEPLGDLAHEAERKRPDMASPRQPPCFEVTVDRKECRVIVLGRRGEKQAIGPCESSNRFVLPVQRLPELEPITVALEPRRLSAVRPCEQPFLFDAKCAQLKSIAIPDAIDKDVDLVQ